jgi:hypothetical protein
MAPGAHLFDEQRDLWWALSRDGSIHAGEGSVQLREIAISNGGQQTIERLLSF